MTTKTALAIMAKQPVIGKTKTRLSPLLNAQEAALLYEAFLLDTIRLVTGLSATVDLVIAITPPESRAYFESIAPPDARIIPVAGADIGKCLESTLAEIFAAGYEKALAMNSDSPNLPLEYLQQAVLLLDQKDVVLGPSQDGGYYLIGMRRLYRGLFQEIEWSTEKVFRQTLERVIELGLGVGLAPPWYDIDAPQDLLRLNVHLNVDLPENVQYTRAILQKLDIKSRFI